MERPRLPWQQFRWYFAERGFSPECLPPGCSALAPATNRRYRALFQQWTRSVLYDGHAEQAQPIRSHRRLYQDYARSGAEVGFEGVATPIQGLSQGYRVTSAVACYLDKR